MTDTQILTLAIALVVPSVAVLYNNKRLDDMKADLIRHIDTGFDHVQLLLKLHEAEHHKK